MDVLKVDVQGAEPQVLEGAEGALRGGKVRERGGDAGARAAPRVSVPPAGGRAQVGLVLFEYAGHWRRMEADAPTMRQVVDMLAAWGYASVRGRGAAAGQKGAADTQPGRGGRPLGRSTWSRCGT